MNDKIVENLLNQMYKEPDLKVDIFSFIQPYITKAYSLLQQDKLSKDSLGQSMLTDIEQKHMMETIIYRDLPSLIDVYTKLPLEYRNEYILKNGQTHRNLLIENMEILAKKLKSLEHAAYENINQTLTIKNRLIKDKYGDDSSCIQLDNEQVQHELENETIDSTYNWNIEKDKILKEDKTIFEKDIIPSKKGFVIKNGKIQVSLGSKIKSLGFKIKNIYVNSSNYVSDKVKKKFTKQMHDTIKDIVEDCLIFILVVGAITSPITVFFGLLYYDATQKSGGHNIAKSHEILNANKELKEISLKTLAKYASDNDLQLSFEADKKQVVLTQNLSSNKCEQVFSYLHKYYSEKDYKFNVNGGKYSSEMNITEENAETICNYDSNKVVSTVPYL